MGTKLIYAGQQFTASQERDALEKQIRDIAAGQGGGWITVTVDENPHQERVLFITESIPLILLP